MIKTGVPVNRRELFYSGSSSAGNTGSPQHITTGEVGFSSLEKRRYDVTDKHNNDRYQCAGNLRDV